MSIRSRYWGEWHHLDNGQKMPSMATQKEIVDVYFKAFSNTRLITLLDEYGGKITAHAAARGTGWRVDCLGDLGWHHTTFIPGGTKAAGVQSQWKVAPVAFESCGNMQSWDLGSLDKIFGDALAYHISQFNNKSAVVPSGHDAQIKSFLLKMGYRYVLERVDYPGQIPAGRFKVRMEWSNRGVAPSYDPYEVAVQVRRPDGSPVVVARGAAVKKMLPGSYTVEQVVQLPASAAAGTYTLAFGIVDPKTEKPAVRLAIKDKHDELWYPLVQVAVKR